MLASFNGKISDPKEISIPLLSDTVMRAYGVFQTMRTYNHKIFRLDQHLSRLKKNAQVLSIEIKYQDSEIAKMLYQLINKLGAANQRVKIVAIKEGILITSAALSFDHKIYTEGANCQSIQCSRGMPEIKSISYLSSFHSHQTAEKNGFYDAILVDKESAVYECAYANLFWFEGKTLCTRKGEVLAGVTRQTVLEITPFPVEYKTIKLSELKKKKEIFLTQSTKGIVPINRIDETTIPLGPKTQNLINLFDQYAQKICQN